MSLTDELRKLGSRLGLVQYHGAQGTPTPVKLATKVVTVDQLRSGIRTDHVTELAQDTEIAPANLTIPFEAIDAAAGIRNPPHGWTAERMESRLRRDDLANLTSDQARQVILPELSAAGAPPEDIVRDAIARDQALDTFALAAHATLRTRVLKRDHRRVQITDTIAALQREAEQANAIDAAELAAWQTWWHSKLARERRLAAAVRLLVSELPVSVDEQVPPLR